jgi:hypothetical protein
MQKITDPNVELTGTHDKASLKDYALILEAVKAMTESDDIERQEQALLAVFRGLKE